jgi:hypothetical protein
MTSGAAAVIADRTSESDGYPSKQSVEVSERSPRSIRVKHTFEITFLGPGVEAYVFTFG